MSANAEFSTTLDYILIGGGVVSLDGYVSTTFDYALDFSAKNLIFGESSNNVLDFEFSSSISLPIIDAQADLNIDFTFSSTIEFGIQTFGTGSARIDFEGSASAYLPVKASLEYSYPFSLNSTITQFSLGSSNVSIDFSVDSNVLNYSEHIYDRLGKNDIEFVSYTSNYVEVLNENNDVQIIENGKNSLVVL